MDKDRNLVVAILGLQLALVQEGQLVEAMRAWIANKKIKFENLLLEKGFINLENKDFLADFADRYIAMNGNDPAKSLASLNSLGRVEKDIQDLGDEEIYQSLFGSSWLRKSLCQRLGIEVEDFENQATETFQNFDEEFGGRFRVLRPHARGGLGQVSIAEDLEVHREVALKEIRPNYASDSSSRQRFMIEAEVTGRLEHPGIVPVYGLGTGKNGNPYYAMRFIKGESLREEIDRLYGDKNFSSSPGYKGALRRLVRRLIDVCNAIEYAHSRGVLHRDLKPANIMLGKYGETLVVDWGLAKTGTKSTDSKATDEQTFVPQSGDSSSVTEMGSVVGTLSYMSPEQAEGRLDALGPPSDVYSLGATLYTILTGESPIPKLPKEEMLELVRNGKIKPPEEANPKAPLALAAICKKAMARKQSDRYPSSQQFAEDLELWLADEPVKAYPEPVLDRVGRLAKKHRTGVVSTVAILATGLIGLAVANVVVQDRNRQLVEEKEKVTKNRDVVRDLAYTLLVSAEDMLSKLPTNTPYVFKLRQDLTEKAFQSFSQIYDQKAGDKIFAFEFAKIARISGNLKRLTGDFETANQRLLLTLDLLESIPASELHLNQKDYLAETHRELGTLRKGQGRILDAGKALEVALRIAQENLNAQPENPLFQRTLATVELEQIGFYSERLEPEIALVKAESCSETFERLFNSSDRQDNDAFLLLFGLARKVKLAFQLKDFPTAKRIAENAVAKAKEVRKGYLENSNVALPYSRILYWSAEGLSYDDSNFPMVDRLILESVAVLSEFSQKYSQTGFKYGLGEALRIQASLALASDDLVDAGTILNQSELVLNELIRILPSGDNLESLALTKWEMAKVEKSAGRPDIEKKLNEETRVLVEKAALVSPESLRIKECLKMMK